MKTNLEELLLMGKEDLLDKLKNIYQAQKLSRTQGYIARGIEIFVALIFIFSGIGIFYSALWTLSILYSLYRFFKPHGEDKEYYEKFELLVEGFENFKKYKNSEISVDIPEKKIKRLEKVLNKEFPKLLEKNGTNKLCKIMAFVPIFNLKMDEMSMYRDNNGFLNRILNGPVGSAGLMDFLDKKSS